MANTLNGLVPTIVARIGFNAFTKALTPLNVFTTDFSGEVVNEGDKVKTRIYPNVSAAVDLQTGGASGDREHSSITKDFSSSLVEITLNKQPASGFSLTDEEMAKIGDGLTPQVVENMLTQHAEAVAEYVLNTTFNLITNADFGAAIATITAASWDSDDIFDISSTLKKSHKWKFGRARTSIVLEPDYVAALQKDNAIQDLSASGMPILMQGDDAIVKRRVGNFMLEEAPALPPSGGTPESENLVGFVCQPSAIAIAMRAVRPQDEDDLIAFEVMEHPETGVTLALRVWSVRGKGRIYWSFETQFGVIKGQTEALKRIVSS